MAYFFSVLKNGKGKGKKKVFVKACDQALELINEGYCLYPEF
jgi:hypothetical protein